MIDPYYHRGEVSNSDLTWLKHMFEPPQVHYDLEKAFKFGRLIDAMITEPLTVDYYRNTVNGEVHDKEDFEKATQMRRAFMRDPFCRKLLEHSTGQMVFSRSMEIHSAITFSLPVRCKYDLWSVLVKWGSDIKSTTATSQIQFEQACHHFEYFRGRAWYMDISGADTDVLIGISKVNYKIFKITINRGDPLYNLGRSQYEELALRWYVLFENLKTKNQIWNQQLSHVL